MGTANWSGKMRGLLFQGWLRFSAQYGCCWVEGLNGERGFIDGKNTAQYFAGKEQVQRIIHD